MLVLVLKQPPLSDCRVDHRYCSDHRLSLLSPVGRVGVGPNDHPLLPLALVAPEHLRSPGRGAEAGKASPMGVGRPTWPTLT